MILTTSSPQHHEHLTTIGATKAFDRNSPTLVQDIHTVSPSGLGVDAIIDAVCSCSNQIDLFKVLREDGPMEYVEVFTGVQQQIPQNVRRTITFGRKLFDMPGGKESGMAALAKLVGDGEFRIPLQVKILGKGFEFIAAGLEELRNGISRTKLIVTV